MALKKRIKKEVKVKNEHQELRSNLATTYFWVKGNIKQFLDSYELTQQQFAVLQILRDNKPKPLTTSQITEKMIDRNSDTSRVVDRLFSKGFVEKKASKTDKRLVDVFITKEGFKLLQKIDRRYSALDKISSNLSDRQIKQLNKLLETLRSE